MKVKTQGINHSLFLKFGDAMWKLLKPQMYSLTTNVTKPSDVIRIDH